MRTTLRRGALLVATALLALVGVERRPGPGRLHRQHRHEPVLQGVQEGRPLLRVQQRRRRRRFAQSGETGVGITRIGIGPNGETVFADNETAMELFLFKHGLSEKIDRPKPPTLNVVWRDGKTRMTIGSNFYLEMSNRVQVRYTHVFPDDAVKLPGTEGAGDSQGSFRIRRAKLKFEGWFYQPWLTYEVQTNWPGLSTRQPRRLSRGREHQLGRRQGQEELHGQARPVQGAVRPPGAHFVGQPAVRRPLPRVERVLPRPRDRTLRVGRAGQQQVRVSRG